MMTEEVKTETLNLNVPNNMCVLDFLAQLKEKTKNAWIFLHKECIEQLENSEGADVVNGSNNSLIITWEGSADMIEYSQFAANGWYTIISINAEDIEFEKIDDLDMPSYIIRLRKAAA